MLTVMLTDVNRGAALGENQRKSTKINENAMKMQRKCTEHWYVRDSHASPRDGVNENQRKCNENAMKMQRKCTEHWYVRDSHASPRDGVNENQRKCNENAMKIQWKCTGHRYVRDSHASPRHGDNEYQRKCNENSMKMHWTSIRERFSRIATSWVMGSWIDHTIGGPWILRSLENAYKCTRAAKKVTVANVPACISPHVLWIQLIATRAHRCSWTWKVPRMVKR